MRGLASRQAGIVGLDQLADIGCTADHWWRARRSPRWELVTRRVLRLAGTPDSDELRVHATIQDAGGEAALHGPSTLAWFGHTRFDLALVHVVRRRETTSERPELGVLHRLRDLEPRDFVVHRGIPTVHPIRAMWSVAAAHSRPEAFELAVRQVGRILDDAHIRGILTWNELHESVHRLGRRGRAGTRIMRDLARTRPPGTSPTESRNEDRFEEIVGPRRRGTLRRQVHVGGVAPIGRADYRDQRRPLVIEVNSRTFHSSPSDQASDEARYAALNRAGFTVGVVWDDDLWRHPPQVVALVDEVGRLADSAEAIVVHSPSCPWPFDPARRLIEVPWRRTRG